jgi:uncharacterized protein (UPF0333 family)
VLQEIRNEIEKDSAHNLTHQCLLQKKISAKSIQVYGNMEEIISAYSSGQKRQLEKYFTLW